MRTSAALLIFSLLGVVGCDECGPQTGVQQLQQELSLQCSFQESAIQRLTKSPSASTQPTITSFRDGQVLAWIDDRTLEPGIWLRRIDPLGTPVGQPRLLTSDTIVTRPRLAATDDTIALVYTASRGDHLAVELQLLDDQLEPLLTSPRVLAPTDSLHGPGITARQGRVVIALARDDGLHIFELDPSAVDGDAGPGGDGGGLGDAGGASLALIDRTVALGEGVHPPGNISLLFSEERLLMASDHTDGWSIQISEIGQDQVRKSVQVLDDRRHPDLRWCCPALARGHDGVVAVMWQGPSIGLTALYLLELDRDWQPIGRERTFEAIVRDEEEQPQGRAPAFDPELATTPGGYVAVFADNRYANSEILMATFTCGGAQ